MTQNTTFAIVCFAYNEKGDMLDCRITEALTADEAITQAKSIKSIEQIFEGHPDCDKIKRVKLEVERRLHAGMFNINGETLWRGSIKRKDN